LTFLTAVPPIFLNEGEMLIRTGSLYGQLNESPLLTLTFQGGRKSLTLNLHHSNSAGPIEVVTFFIEVVIVGGIEVVEVVVVVRLREVMMVLVLVGDFPDLMAAWILEVVVVLVAWVVPLTAVIPSEGELSSVGDFDLQLK
jgi:hypothetical protein